MVSAIAQLLVDSLRAALGIGVPFSWLAWGYVTVLLLVVGPTVVQVGPKFVDPPARMIATQPVRVVGWMLWSILATIGVVVLLFVTILGIPASLLLPLGMILVGGVGYLALARLLGESLGRVLLGTEQEVPPWVAALLGILAFRIVRLVPGAGAAAHTLICWVGYAAACAVLCESAWRWHRRRLPDAVQFRGETMIEWYPDGDPADGRPAFGTGRPVLDNVRGDEDRDRAD